MKIGWGKFWLYFLQLLGLHFHPRAFFHFSWDNKECLFLRVIVRSMLCFQLYVYIREWLPVSWLQIMLRVFPVIISDNQRVIRVKMCPSFGPLILCWLIMMDWQRSDAWFPVLSLRCTVPCLAQIRLPGFAKLNR